MKKMIACLLLAGFFAACNSDKTTKSEADTKSAPVTPGIENVNGNIPDTTRAIRLNRPLPKDSSQVTDSTRH
jgi:hypothetical protein